MQTIAITYWNGLVSPLYDAAAQILIVREDGTRVMCHATHATVHQKFELLERHRVTLLICGAISAQARALLVEGGVRVADWICGPVEDVLGAVGAGTLHSGPWSMPGCAARRHCRRQGQRERRHCCENNLPKGSS